MKQNRERTGHVYTLSAYDIGKPTISVNGKFWPVEEFIGNILPRDVGKRVYLHNGALQVENQEQLEERLASY